jgi:hypothetical protein
MIAYTNIKGRGKTHGFGFSAATARLPYGAAWTNQPRDKDTLGNTPVLEVQANTFGEMLLIRSQVVKLAVRPFGVTQYVHPLPTEEELADDTPAAFFARHLGNLLFYSGFYPAEQFPELDDDPSAIHKVLAPEPFTLPAIPADEPIVCEDRLLGPLLAELWKNCDARIRRERISNPMRICVCDSAHAADTLEVGRLFMAKTVIPKLPPAVRNILSVTIGARGDMTGAYENTACCVAQFETDRIGTGYDLVNRNLFANLQPGEATFGMALLKGEHMEYYRHLERVAGISTLSADFQVALSLFAMRQFLGSPSRFADQPARCFELWKSLEKDIAKRYEACSAPAQLREILYPVERDIVLLQAAAGADATLGKSDYAELAQKAFTLADDLPANQSELWEPYARCLALPRQAENTGKPCFDALLHMTRLDLRAASSAAMFVTALQIYMAASPAGVPLATETLVQVEQKMRTMGEANLLRQKEALQACIDTCCRNRQPQRVINRLCEAFALEPAFMDSKVQDRLRWDLESSQQFALTLHEYFDYPSARTDPELRAAMLMLLDKRFEAVALTPEAWRGYVDLCTAIGHTAVTAQLNAWLGLKRIRAEQIMTDAEMDTLLAFCRLGGNEAAMGEAAFHHYDARSGLYTADGAMRNQMQRWAEQYPALLAPDRPSSIAWDTLRAQTLEEALAAATACSQSWAALLLLPKAWRQALKAPLADDALWRRLPELAGEEAVTRTVAETCERVLAADTLSLTDAAQLLARVKDPADWFTKALRTPVLAHVGNALDDLWLTLGNEADVLALARLIETLAAMAAEDGRALPYDGEVGIAAALYLEACVVFTDGDSGDGQHVEARLMQAAALAGKLAACRYAEGIAKLLRARLNMGDSLPPATPLAVMEACLACLARYRGRLEIDWRNALALISLSGAPRGKPLTDGINPWSNSGKRLLRSLLVCLSVSDRLKPDVNPYPLQRYLRDCLPRLTVAVRRKRSQRRHLRAYAGPRGKPAALARQTLGGGAVSWLFE